MSEDLNATPPNEPGNPPTLDGGPAQDSGNGSISPPQPTLEEMQAKLARMEANVAGRSREAEEERQRRRTLEDQLESMRRAQPVAPQPTQTNEPSDEELAKALSRASIDGDEATLSRILGIQRQKTVRESQQNLAQMIGQANAFSQQQQSYTNYLTNTGLKPGSALQQKATEIEKEISDDIKYNGQGSQYWFTGGNQAWIRSIAAERAKSFAANERGDAHETMRRSTSAGAGTESGGNGAGAPPGKSAAPATAIYLTPAEQKAAHSMYDNLSKAEAEKRYWNAINPNMREARNQAKKAIA